MDGSAAVSGACAFSCVCVGAGGWLTVLSMLSLCSVALTFVLLKDTIDLAQPAELPR